MNITPFDVNYFDFDCIRNILNKNYGKTISFKAEKIYLLIMSVPMAP